MIVETKAGGGGDSPESMNEALHETVHQLSWRGDGATRLLVLLADAPPHLDYGTPYYDEAMAAALGKGIKVFGVGASVLKIAITSSAYLVPGLSLSGKMTTSRPASGVQSVNFAELAPWAEAVAVRPSARIASVFFSPSLT